MATDKKISELPIASSISADDVCLLVSNGTSYQFAFTTLLQFISTGITTGAALSFGTTLPQNNAGKNGDVFVNTATGAFAQKIAGMWTVVYTLPSVAATLDGTVLYGLGSPGTLAGNNNDTYIDTGSGIFYKKTGGNWGQVFSMQTGPAGAQGTKGDTGATGANGKSILSGPGNPSNLSTGTNGDFYINTSTYTLFGPKTGGNWGAGIALVPDVVNDKADLAYVDQQDVAEATARADADTGLQDQLNDEVTARANGDAALADQIDSRGMPAGGTSGQILAKVDGDDYHAGWINPPAGGGGGPALADGLVSGGEGSVSGQTLTILPAIWRIGGVSYSTSSSQIFTLSTADLVNSRYDVVYADTTGLHLLQGDTSANPVKPSTPANTVEIAAAYIQPGTISTIGAQLAAYATLQDIKAITGDKSDLQTDATNTLVEAINEVRRKLSEINQDQVTIKAFKYSNYR
jgi:hypothetical protein